MSKLTRRTLLKSSVAGMAAIAVPSHAASFDTTATPRKGRIRQSVSRWCYEKIPLDQLCEYAAKIGLKGVDLLQVEEYEIPRRYGLMTMVAEKRAGTWLIVAAQNDNSFPGLPPEFEGITSPMPIPDQVGSRPAN